MTLLTLTSAQAATIWEMSPTERSTMSSTGFRMTVAGGQALLEHFPATDLPAAQVLMLSGTNYVFDHRRKVYQVSDPQFFQRLAASMAQLEVLQQAQLAALPADIQAWLKSVPAPPPASNTVRATGLLESVGSYRCSIVELRVNGALVTDYCAVPFDSVRGGLELQTIITAQQRRRDIPSHLKTPHLAGNSGAPDWAPPSEVRGLPIRIRHYSPGDGHVISTMLTRSIRISPTVPNTFAVPAGYRREVAPEVPVPTAITKPTAEEIANMRQMIAMQKKIKEGLTAERARRAADSPAMPPAKDKYDVAVEEAQRRARERALQTPK